MDRTGEKSYPRRYTEQEKRQARQKQFNQFLNSKRRNR